MTDALTELALAPARTHPVSAVAVAVGDLFKAADSLFSFLEERERTKQVRSLTEGQLALFRANVEQAREETARLKILAEVQLERLRDARQDKIRRHEHATMLLASLGQILTFMEVNCLPDVPHEWAHLVHDRFNSVLSAFVRLSEQ